MIIWNLLKACTRAMKVIFICCFLDPRGLLSRARHNNFVAKHLKFGSSYSNYRMRGLSCWHVITRTQLSSFLFPLKPCHANFLTCVNLRNMESLSSEHPPELFYSFFLLAREKKRRQPSVWTTEWADKHPFLAVHQQDRLSCLCQRIIWSKIWPTVSNVHSVVR